MNFLFLVTFFSVFLLSLCNIWDNIFTNIKSPQYQIPEEFKMNLINDATGGKMGEICVSCSLNKAKLTLILEDKKNSSAEVITNVLLDLNNGTIFLDDVEKCVYVNSSMMNGFTIKFFLNAYDILAYFSENGKHYDYILTDPFSLGSDLGKLLKGIYEKPNFVNFKVDKQKLLLDKIELTFESIKSLTITPIIEYRNLTESDFTLINKVCVYNKTMFEGN